MSTDHPTLAARRKPDRTHPAARARYQRRRWAALGVIALAQLMVVVDATIVNIALPSATRDLHMSVADRQWVVTAYTIAFGGLLLLGGRIADYAGRKRAFLLGLVGFAGASVVAGASTGFEMLICARAAQGAFGALLAPAALSLVAVTFTDPKERAKAFGAFGAVAAGGSAIGLLLGGVLTDYLDWTWCLYVNAPIAAIAFAAAVPTLQDTSHASRQRYDLPGALLATGGLVALVYGFSKAETEGWGAAITAGLIAGGVVLLALFVLAERLVRNPLLPLRIPADRTRGGAYLSVLLAVVGMFAILFFLTFYLQQIKGFSPTRTGVAFLPLTGGVIVAAGISSRLGARIPPRYLLTAGLAILSGGMFVLTRLSVDGGYAGTVLPVLVTVGSGLGAVMVTSVNAATLGVRHEDAGVASATVNAAQQVGASLGTALLSTVAADAASSYLAGHLHAAGAAAARLQQAAAVHGYAVAAWYGCGILAAGAIAAFLLVRGYAARTSSDTSSAGAE